MVAKSTGIQTGKATRASRTVPPASRDKRRDLLESGALDFQPRYARVAQSLIEDIASGKFPVGSLIATEADLCDRFGVSRNTARAALAVLSDMGLVTRHAGIGTFVRSVTADARYVQEAESVSALFPNIEATEQRTLSECMFKADASLAK
ncbi:MAG: GntR family transcriptional regulator, partial [Rubrivivax sp.]|nr:GntR family transcriptional regulator [Rubrivivax sp.]